MANKVKVFDESNRMNLAHALKQLKEQYPWLPVAAIRRAVTSGKVPSVRSSNAKRAYYYVYLEDLMKLLPRTESE
jgi:hypothetical protein